VPLIDVMFFLLASFMLVSLSLQKSQTVKVKNLPWASTAVADFKPDVLNLGVDRAGTVYVGAEAVDPAQLTAVLKQALTKGGPTAPVFITADQQTSLGEVNKVLRRVRETGFQKVSFITSGKAGGPADSRTPRPMLPATPRPTP